MLIQRHRFDGSLWLLCLNQFHSRGSSLFAISYIPPSLSLFYKIKAKDFCSFRLCLYSSACSVCLCVCARARRTASTRMDRSTIYLRMYADEIGSSSPQSAISIFSPSLLSLSSFLSAGRRNYKERETTLSLFLRSANGIIMALLMGMGIRTRVKNHVHDSQTPRAQLFVNRVGPELFDNDNEGGIAASKNRRDNARRTQQWDDHPACLPPLTLTAPPPPPPIE